MKRFICLMLTALFTLSCPLHIAFASSAPWETEYARILSDFPVADTTKFILADIDYDNAPELIAGDEKAVSVFTYKNSSVMKICENKGIPVSYFEHLKTAQHNETNLTSFMGQVVENTDVFTYKMRFAGTVPSLEIVAIEHSDRTGTFKGDNDITETLPDCTAQVSLYLSGYSLRPFTLCSLSAKEIHAAGAMELAAQSFFARYNFLLTLSDDTASVTKEERDALKKTVDEGAFLGFDKISRLNSNEVLVQYYTADESAPVTTFFPYHKRYAVVNDASKKATVSFSCNHESELNTELLTRLKTLENDKANLYIDYTKTMSFRGIDDYVRYLSQVLSSQEEPVNENGKKELSDYIEYAVTQCARSEIKAKSNTVRISASSVSFVAEHAISCAERLNQLCNTGKVAQLRKASVVPELVCTGLDLTKPIRIEYEKDVFSALSGASGLRLMLDHTTGIYIKAFDLAVLNSASKNTFCIEIKKTGSQFSVVFTDRENILAETIEAPVWFILPAQSEYSTVIASFMGGTDNWGGQFDPEKRTIEFSTIYSGDYEIVENDITINDIGDLPQESQKAIRFLVSKGIFETDKRNRFSPNATLSRYDFTTALVKMFYATDVNAVSRFLDISPKSAFYRYIASAEQLQIAEGYTDDTFRGELPVSREQVVTLCGRTLVEQKDYAYPKNPEQYLPFSDVSDISQWARANVAVSVQCGLIGGSDAFLPFKNVTRAEGAEILYKTFMLLYDTSPVTTTTEDAVNEGENAALTETIDFEFRAALCILFSVVMLFVLYIGTKLYKRKKRNS